MNKNRLKKKVIAGALTAGMAVGIGFAGLGATHIYAAEGDSVTYDFRDGSIIPTDTDGKSDVTNGDITVKVGTQNAYQYNGAQHGVAFKTGNTVEIKVDGPAKITVGDCAYSANASLTLSSADGSWSQTKDAKNGCYHNDESAVVFKYPGEATTLVLNFEGTTYVPCITVTEGINDVPDENGVPADSIYMYNFADNSVIPAEYDSANPLNGTITSADGFISLTGNNDLYYHDNSHGIAVFNGNTIEVKVAGDAVITFSTCEYGVDDTAYWQVKNSKGEIISENKQPAVLKDYDGQSSVFKYEGVATTLTFTLVGNKGEYYLHGVNVANLPAETETPELVGNGKIDVWDFAAEKLDETKYNNMLTEDIINSWYDSSVEKGSAGVTINSFATQDILFNASGRTNNRLRTTNEAITRYDSKSLNFTEEDGSVTELKGYVYSNSASTSRVYTGIKLYEGDIVTVYTGSNGGTSTIYFESPSGEIQKGTSVSAGAKLTFYASEYGIYKMYSLDEKLVVYRMYREHTAPILTQGKITAPSSLEGYKLVFTNNKTGKSESASPAADGTYNIWLREGYDYSLSLENANGYVITSADKVTVEAQEIKTTIEKEKEEEVYTVVKGDMLKVIAKKYGCSIWDIAKLNNLKNPDLILIGQKLRIPSKGTATEEVTSTGFVSDVKIESVDLVKMTGKITGLDAKALADLKLSFVNEDSIYVPELTIAEDGTITAQLEKGVTYEIVAENINDYYLASAESISLNKNKTQNIKFAAKPVYEVDIQTSGIDDETFANAVMTFTNINEPGYSYTFKPASETVKLRDGQYSVSVSGVGSAVAQKLTADVKVNKKATSAKVNFETLKTWSFEKLNSAYGGAGIETIGDSKFYSGLVLNDAVLENKIYLLLNAGGEIKVPVKAGDVVTANYCYCAGFEFNGDAATAVDEKSGSTSQIDTAVYKATEDGYVTISAINGTNSTQTYFTSIVVTTPVEYKETVTVGVDKEYTTINSALEAIAAMDRTDEQRVTIMVDPGNYEEMLVINIPNITIANAAGEKASLELANKGVDITENAVRITSYYGHGYSYYSMGTDCKYDEELLEINKSNGYLAFKNPGTGTTSGSYWNATVVVYASGFEADGIIFENSYNQYISEKEANDVIVLESGNKGVRPTTAGDTSVQDRSFVERAAALAITGGCEEIYFNNCKFIGRQDTLYGAETATVAFNKCDILGACDYIFGGMTAVFNECNLVMNTSDNSADVTYITAAQQSTSRGFLFYDCTVTSTTPGVDTASTYASKPGYFGRPWAANTSEVVFYNTTVEAACDQYENVSLIAPAGWLSTLGGESKKMYEYGTKELAGTDNTASRVSWSTVLTKPELSDGTDISTKDKAVAAFLGSWNPFDAE